MWWTIYFFRIILINKRLKIRHSYWMTLISLWFINATIAYWKHLLLLFFGLIVAFLFFSHLGESTYDLGLFSFIFLKFIFWNLYIKNKLALSHFFFKPFLISLQKRFKKWFDNIICFTTHQNIYIVTFHMHSTNFIAIFRRNKINCHW